MVAQQKATADDTPSAPREKSSARAKSERDKARTKPPQRERLTYKDQHALKTLPGEIDKLGAEIDRLQTELAAPDLFTRDPKRFEAAAAALEQAQSSLAAAEERWLELEMKRESLEGG